MEYLQSLSDHLIKHICKKEELNAWAEDGELLFSPNNTEDGYEIRYRCNFEISDIELNPARFFMIIANWVQLYNPDRDTQGSLPPLFFVERLANGRYDIGLKIEFIEQMRFVLDEAGEWLVAGEKYSLQSDFQQPFSVSGAPELMIVDSHLQDNSLSN